MNILNIIIVILIILSYTSHSMADFVNGSYEAGNFTGWSSIGNTSVKSQDAIGIAPTQGIYQAYLSTENLNGQGASASSLESFIDVPSGSLDNVVNGIAIQGSVLQQTVTAHAGDALSFNWNFLTSSDNLNSPLDDFSFVSISNVGIFLLADTNSNFISSNSYVFDSETGYQSFNLIIPKDGSYTVSFGVIDVYSTTLPSGLAIDNVSLTSSVVPEPASMIPMGIGMVTLAGYSVYRGKREQ